MIKEEAPIKLRWRQAIHDLLTDQLKPMHYLDITKEVIKSGFKTRRKNPEQVVRSILNEESAFGDHHPPLFYKLSPDVFCSTQCDFHQLDDFVDSGAGNLSVNKGRWSQPENLPFSIRQSPAPIGTQPFEIDRSATYSFGLGWDAGVIAWSRPVIWGIAISDKRRSSQDGGAKYAVNMNPQIGVYALYQGKELVYIGRSIDRPIIQRLKEHTVDRLSGKWDCFSWVGMLSINKQKEMIHPASMEDRISFFTRPEINDEDDLLQVNDSDIPCYTTNQAIALLESAIITLMAPSLNRRGGDGGVEYLQFP